MLVAGEQISTDPKAGFAAWCWIYRPEGWFCTTEGRRAATLPAGEPRGAGRCAVAETSWLGGRPRVAAARYTIVSSKTATPSSKGPS